MSENDSWRRAIEERLDRHGKRLDEHGSWLQTLWNIVLGPTGANGLRSEVRDMKERMRVQGMIPSRTVWVALGALASVGLLIAAIAFGAQ